MRFSTTMFQIGNNTGIEVPAAVLEALDAGKRPPVVVTVNGYSYRSTVAPMGGKYLLPFSAERRGESGISGGDAIDVELVVDSAPRVIDVPEDLRTALDGSPDASAAWAKLSYSNQKAHVTSVLGAKAADTRARRIAAVVAKLRPERLLGCLVAAVGVHGDSCERGDVIQRPVGGILDVAQRVVD